MKIIGKPSFQLVKKQSGEIVEDIVIVPQQVRDNYLQLLLTDRAKYIFEYTNGRKYTFSGDTIIRDHRD